jgi:hypothetical protein
VSCSSHSSGRNHLEEPVCKDRRCCLPAGVSAAPDAHIRQAGCHLTAWQPLLTAAEQQAAACSQRTEAGVAGITSWQSRLAELPGSAILTIPGFCAAPTLRHGALVSPDTCLCCCVAVTAEACSARGGCLGAAPSNGTQDSQQQSIDLNRLPGVIKVGSNTTLSLVNLQLNNVAYKTSYVPSEAQPFRTEGVGTGLWPSIQFAPKSTVGSGLW